MYVSFVMLDPRLYNLVQWGLLDLFHHHVILWPGLISAASFHFLN